MSIAIAGAGSIGVAFAVLFAMRGHPVRLWDPVPGALDRAGAEIADRLDLLARFGALTGTREAVLSRIRPGTRLDEVVEGTVLVQECAPENRELKHDLFAQLGQLTGADTVLASSSSALPASAFAADLPARGRILVGHPGNPPYLLPVVEIVPAPATEGWAVEAARAIYAGAGLRPVVLKREIEGFIFNRLQGALLREAYCLVRDGVASVEDVDEVVRSGPGRRWGLIGPFETADLNTRGGIERHAERLGPAYARMGAERGQNDPWTPELVAEVARQRRALLPLDQWEARVRWRDEELLRRFPPQDGDASD